jgi:hypothetical protein
MTYDLSTPEGQAAFIGYLKAEHIQGKNEFRISFQDETNFIIHPLGKDGQTQTFNIK